SGERPLETAGLYESRPGRSTPCPPDRRGPVREGPLRARPGSAGRRAVRLLAEGPVDRLASLGAGIRDLVLGQEEVAEDHDRVAQVQGPVAVRVATVRAAR